MSSIDHLKELERQVLTTGTCEFITVHESVQFLKNFGYRKAEAYLRAITRRMMRGDESRNGMYGRKVLAEAYRIEFLPARQWPAVELPGTVTKDGRCIVTDPCPYCGKRHIHGAGYPGPVLWGSRVPHCRELPSCYGQYILTPKVPQ